MRALLPKTEYTQIWSGIHHRVPTVANPKLRSIQVRLEDEKLDLKEITPPLDLVIHFAGVTHTADPETYWNVNFRGTMRLADAARALGCRRFVYVSTRCATEGSGSYGESKLAAERGLRAMEWDRLLILRPAEIYGAGGKEGVDKFLSLAERFRFVPLLWGHKELRFAPLAANDFVTAATALIQMNQNGTEVLDMCGPEELKASSLAMRIAKKYRALPVPIWWPCLRVLLCLGSRIIVPDQLTRLIGRKTARHSTPNVILNRMTSRFLRS